MPRRLRVHHSPIALGSVALRGEAFAYAAVVHRARVGHAVELFDGEGRRGVGQFTAFDAEAAHLVVTEVGEDASELRPVTLVQALGKGEKVEESLRDACELGLAEFVAVEASRSVRKLDAAARAKLLARLERIAAEAARQSHAARVATIAAPASLEDAFAASRPGLKLVFDPSGAVPLFERLRATPPLTSITIAVGPEGGFTAAELAAARDRGWRAVRLGETVLRTETMAAAALGAIRAFDDADERPRDPLAGADEDRSA
jgi:16S rRNA (uracil1498-N3)-methyltransferase